MGTYFKQAQQQVLQAKYGENSPKCKQQQFFEYLKCDKGNMQIQLQCHANIQDYPSPHLKFTLPSM